ncbi:MAG: CxxC-x17-CxxC domain-containing protein [Minisyncoccales bacterium]
MKVATEETEESNERHRFEEKRMFSATCSKCGKKFELPFKPTGERNVYCNDCFKGDGNNPTTKDSTNQCNKEQMEALGKKLDKIIELLTPKAIEKDGSVEIKEKKAKEKKEVKKKAATKKK